jgi:hypothetical protein
MTRLRESSAQRTEQRLVHPLLAPIGSEEVKGNAAYSELWLPFCCTLAIAAQLA